MYRRIRIAGRQRAPRPDAIGIALFEKTSRLPAGYAKLDKSVAGFLSKALRRPELSLEKGTATCLYPAGGIERLFVLGLGPRGQARVGDALRVGAAKLVRAAHSAAVKRIELQLSPILSDVGDVGTTELAGRAFADGLAIANLEIDQFKGGAGKAGNNKPKSNFGLEVHIDGAAMRQGVERGLRIGESVNLARTLAATPPNVANPSYLVSFCRRMARQVGLKCTVIDVRRAEKLKMGGLLAVGAAGSTPPAIICMEYKPGRTDRASGRRRKGPVLLVGKAITFDTGGYSIKPASSMDSMKYDKCGGMAVIGAMHAIARLRIPLHVVGLIPTAENMIGEKGYRPGDILRMFNGTTVEVTNTDAEGRLVLGDALAYGCKTFRPSAIVDLATLTGGVVVALGSACAGAFCRDHAWWSHLQVAGDDTAERLWQLPLWDEHKTLLKSQHADIVNAGSREAHPIQGAAFLSHFVDEKIPWAHLDIAGVADLKNANDLFTKGPTGFGVRLLVRALETWK